VGRAVAALAADARVQQKSGQILFASDLAAEYGFTDVDGRVPNFPAMFDANVAKIAVTPPVNEQGRFLLWARYCQIHQDPNRRELALKLMQALNLLDLGPALAPAGKVS
jgi:hypothetical protein